VSNFLKRFPLYEVFVVQSCWTYKNANLGSYCVEKARMTLNGTDRVFVR
jgi:hypothetical protein